ncbi:hypothetical protein TNCV_2727301 [Trichonephila clavipes]|nr:hypothetical protein TNCV_2727301 [Trichonephila clavipes]
MIERNTGSDARVYCNHFAIYKALGRDTTNFDSEVEAVFIAFYQLNARKSYFPLAVILSNLKADLPSVSNSKVCTSIRICEFKNILNTLVASNVLQLIPAYCGIDGNEKERREQLFYKLLITICLLIIQDY